MAIPLIAVGVGVGIAGIASIIGGVVGLQREEARHQVTVAQTRVQRQLNTAVTSQDLDQYIIDNTKLGNIDPITSRDALLAYRKAAESGINSLNKREANTLKNLYNDLYKNSETFRANWDTEYSKLSDDEKLEWLEGALGGGGVTVTVPAPAYLDTSFDTYQKKVEPVKFYTNAELAKLYNIDFNYENILEEFKTAGDAKVKYSRHLADVAKYLNEQTVHKDEVSYLDAIRNVKARAVSSGMTAGAKAAQEVLATRQALENKVKTNLETAVSRGQTMSDAFLERAQADINAGNTYTNLAKMLSRTGVDLYANDIARYGADLNANANFFAADETLRANNIAANMEMSAAYNAASAQAAAYNAAARAQTDETMWLLKNVMLPANNGNVDRAIIDTINLNYLQNTGYRSPVEKYTQ